MNFKSRFIVCAECVSNDRSNSNEDEKYSWKEGIENDYYSIINILWDNIVHDSSPAILATHGTDTTLKKIMKSN